MPVTNVRSKWEEGNLTFYRPPDSEGKLISDLPLSLTGDGRYVNLIPFTSMDIFPTHHAPLEVTAPAATVDIMNVAELPEIPITDWVTDGTPRRAHTMQFCRLGDDDDDTYTGSIDIVAVLYIMKSNKFGGAESLF